VSALTKAYRVRIAQPGATGTSTATVAFTSTVLAEAPTVLHPTVRPLQGRTESRPWGVTLVDHGSSFTAQLADSSGRTDLLGRLIWVDRNLAGAGMVRHGTGRITDVMLQPSVTEYRVVIEDERRIERNTRIFSTNTTRLFPPGPHIRYGDHSPPPKGRFQVTFTETSAPGSTVQRYALCVFERQLPLLTEGAFRAMESDVVENVNRSTVGNFNTLRLRVGNTDYPVVRFGAGPLPSDIIGEGAIRENERERLEEGNGGEIGVWVVASSSQLPEANTFTSAFLHMFAHAPTEDIPLHLPTTHPMQILQAVYDGDYGGPGVRYSTAAMATVQALSMPRVSFRVTDQEVMAEWLDENIYHPHLVAPFVDSSGKVVPRSLDLPDSTADITFTFTAANLREPHPTWNHNIRDAVTVLRLTHSAEHFYRTGHGQRIDDYPADRIVPREVSSTYVHDRSTSIGLYEHEVFIRGQHHRLTGRGITGQDPQFNTYPAWAKHRFFNRFGDGPIYGEMHALTTAEDVQAGDWGIINLETMPNPSSGGVRGGTRYVQLLQRDDTPDGPRFSYWDGGRAAQPLDAPDFALSTDAASPHHGLTVTLTSHPDVTGLGFELQFAQGGTSGRFDNRLTTFNSTGVYRFGAFKSGTTWAARMRSVSPWRLPSTWRYSTANVATDALTAPTLSTFQSSEITEGTALMRWTNGESAYPIEVMGDDSTSAALSTANRAEILQAGSNQYLWTFDSTGSYLVGARHRDAFGGVSPTDSTAFTSSDGGLPNAPSLLGFSVVWGFDRMRH